MIGRWTRFSVRHRWLMLAIWIVLVGATLPLAAHVTKHLTTNGFERPGSEGQWATNAANRIKTGPKAQPLLVQQISEAAAKKLGVEVHIPESAFHAIHRDQTLVIPPTGFSVSKARQFRQLIASRHGTTKVVSQIAIGKLVTHDASKTLGSSVVLAMPVLAVMLLFVFGSVAAVSLPLIIALAGSELSLAIVSLISRWMQLSVFLTDIVSFLALGVGVDYALFISTRYRQNLDAGQSVEDAVVDAMSHAGRSVMYSGIAVGLAVATLVFGANAYWRGLAVGGGRGNLYGAAGDPYTAAGDHGDIWPARALGTDSSSGFRDVERHLSGCDPPSGMGHVD